MLKPYRTIDAVLNSPLASITPPAAQDTTDRVLRSTKLEDSIYADLRNDDGSLHQIEQDAGKKLASFPALARDVFQSFYSLLPRRHGEESLSVEARKFNAPILDHIVQSEDFPTLKSICEGRELPAYEAASEFISQTAGELDDLLSDLGGGKNELNTLEKLEKSEEQAQKDLTDLLERIQRCKEHDAQLEQSVVDAANRLDSKRRQVEAVGKMIDTSAAQHKEDMTAIVSQAVSAAAEKAEEVQNIIGAWSDEPGKLEKNEVNTGLLDLVRFWVYHMVEVKTVRKIIKNAIQCKA